MERKEFTLFLCLSLSISVIGVTATNWPNLRTTFGINPFGNAFDQQPRTREQAVQDGFLPISNDQTCVGKHLGFAYADPYEPSLVILFDEAGYISGVQSVLLKSAVDEAYLNVSRIPAYTEGRFFKEEAWFTTAYFVDPEVICNGGRTKDQWNLEGTGNRLWIQVGNTPDNFVKIPLTQAEADGEDNWYKHFCFFMMATHYMEFNHQIDQDCNSVLPIQILYNKGVISGFVWQHNARLPGKRWEHPDANAIKRIVDRPAQCTLDLSEIHGLSTLHHYFTNRPWFTFCSKRINSKEDQLVQLFDQEKGT